MLEPAKTINIDVKDIPFQPNSTKLSIRFLTSGIIFHVAQMITTALLIAMLFDEPFLVFKPQSYRKDDEKLSDNLVIDMPREPFDNFPMSLDKLWV